MYIYIAFKNIILGVFYRNIASHFLSYDVE